MQINRMKNIKKVLVPFLLILVSTAVFSKFLPTSIGHFIYNNATDIEAQFYGLQQDTVDIGELSISLYQNEKKNRPTLLMLHGYSADKDVWPRFAKYFTDDYHIVIPDMAGHGETEFNSEWSYSAPAQAERMAKLLAAMNIESAHVIGNSMGGFIAAHFAKAYPDQTLSATLVDPAGVISPQDSVMETMLANDNNPFIMENTEQFHQFYAMTMESPPWLPELVLNAIAETYFDRHSSLKQIFNDFDHTDMLDEQLNDINVPVLILWGEKDQLIHVSSIAIWQAGIKNSESHVWPGIGHMPMVEIPNLAAQRYQEFLSKVSQ